MTHPFGRVPDCGAAWSPRGAMRCDLVAGHPGDHEGADVAGYRRTWPRHPSGFGRSHPTTQLRKRTS